MNIKKTIVLLMAACLAAGFLTGCSKAKKEASQTMTDYLNHIIASEYSEAYAMLSDFDKGNISEEDFASWRELAAKLISIESFTIDSKVDIFKDYKYLGTEFGNVFGLKINSKQKVLIFGAELAAYDKSTYRIMVQQDGDDYRVLLLVTGLDETIAMYKAYTEKLK